MKTPIPVDDSLSSKLRGMQQQLDTQTLRIREEIEKCQRIEEALRTAQSYAKNIIDSSLDMIIAVDPERKIVEFNKAAQKAFGYTSDEVIGKHISMLYAAADESSVVYQDVKQGGQFVGEILNKRKNGEVFPCLLAASTLYDANGNVIGSMGISRDIAAQKQAEEALKESEERYRSLVELSPEAIVMHQAGRFVYANPAAVQLLAASGPEELIGKPILDVVHPDYRNIVTARMRQVYEEGQIAPLIEEKLIRLDGQVIDVEIIGVPVTYRGAPATQTVIRDITERKRAEEALRDSEEKFRSIGSAARDAIITMDSTGNISFWNEGAERIFGYAKAEVLGKELHRLLAPPRYYEVYKKSFKIFQEIGKGSAIGKMIEATAIRKDGSEFPMELSLSAIKLQGKWTAIGILRNITGRKLAEQMLQESEKRYRSIFENATIGIFQVTAEGKFLTLNPALARILGYLSPKEAMTAITNIAEQVWVDPRNWREIIEMAQTIPEAVKVETRCRTKDGREMIVRLNIWAIRDEQQHVRYFEGFIEDITERRKTENALIEERNLLRTLIDSLPEFIYVKNPDRRFMLANKAALQAMRITSLDHLLGQTEDEISSPVLTEQHRDAECQVLTSGQPQLDQEESLFDFETGAAAWLLSSVVPFYDSQRNIAGIVGVHRDITELKKTENMLRDQAFLLRGIAGAMTRLLVAADFDTAISETLELLGIATGVDRIYIYESHPHPDTGEPAMSQRFTWAQNLFEVQINAPDAQNLLYKEGFSRWHELLNSHNIVSGVIRDFPPSERSVLEAQGVLSILVIPIAIQGKFWGFIGFNNCQTDRQWSEEEESILFVLAGSIGGAIARRKAEADLIAANRELKETLATLQKAQAQLIQSEKLAALGQLVAGIAHEINTPLGAIRSSIINIASMLEHTLEQLPAFFRSLSEERQRQFFALLKRALQRDPSLSSKEERKQKRALVEKLTHQDVGGDLRKIAEILVTMGVYDNLQPFLPLLQDSNGSAMLNMAYRLVGLQESTQTILTATDRASKVVFALKTYAHFDHSGKMIEANLIGGIETVLTLYSNQLKYGVEVRREYEELPPILCYPDELHQVWTNLIHNALQAMQFKGTLTIAVNLTPHPSPIGKGQGEGWVSVSITDTGCGIPDEIKTKIFEPFFTTKPSGEGSGLGLDIVRKIIDKHHGKIILETHPGKTTFHVLLPIRA